MQSKSDIFDVYNEEALGKRKRQTIKEQLKDNCLFINQLIVSAHLTGPLTGVSKSKDLISKQKMEKTTKKKKKKME